MKWQIYWQIYPIDLPVKGNFKFLLYKLFLADQVADLPPPIEHRSIENHYTESVDMYYLTLADQVADLPPFLQSTIEPLNTTTPKVADLLPP